MKINFYINNLFHPVWIHIILQVTLLTYSFIILDMALHIYYVTPYLEYICRHWVKFQVKRSFCLFLLAQWTNHQLMYTSNTYSCYCYDCLSLNLTRNQIKVIFCNVGLSIRVDFTISKQSFRVALFTTAGSFHAGRTQTVVSDSFINSKLLYLLKAVICYLIWIRLCSNLLSKIL